MPESMDTAQKIEAFSERIKPHLEELGIRGFLMVAYMEDADGKVHRVTLGADGGNPAYSDGLRTMQIVAVKWNQGLL